jgi:hypothetical protein
MERLAMQAIADEVTERQKVRDQNLAVMITERIGKMLGAK